MSKMLENRWDLDPTQGWRRKPMYFSRYIDGYINFTVFVSS